MHGYRLSSEEICKKYAAQTMFWQSQAFPIKKKPESQIVSVFFISKKKNVEKKHNFKTWLQRSRIGNPAITVTAVYTLL